MKRISRYLMIVAILGVAVVSAGCYTVISKSGMARQYPYGTVTDNRGTSTTSPGAGTIPNVTDDRYSGNSDEGYQDTRDYSGIIQEYNARDTEGYIYPDDVLSYEYQADDGVTVVNNFYGYVPSWNYDPWWRRPWFAYDPLWDFYWDPWWNYQVGFTWHSRPYYSVHLGWYDSWYYNPWYYDSWGWGPYYSGWYGWQSPFYRSHWAYWDGWHDGYYYGGGGGTGNGPEFGIKPQRADRLGNVPTGAVNSANGNRSAVASTQALEQGPVARREAAARAYTGDTSAIQTQTGSQRNALTTDTARSSATAAPVVSRRATAANAGQPTSESSSPTSLQQRQPTVRIVAPPATTDSRSSATNSGNSVRRQPVPTVANPPAAPTYIPRSSSGTSSGSSAGSSAPAPSSSGSTSRRSAGSTSGSSSSAGRSTGSSGASSSGSSGSSSSGSSSSGGSGGSRTTGRR